MGFSHLDKRYKLAYVIKKKQCWQFVQVIAWFVVIFGRNTASDFSKLLYVISQAVRRVKFETILKYHKCMVLMPNITYKSRYYLFILLPTKRFVIFTCRYFKLNWNITALSQSNCRNFSCSSIRASTGPSAASRISWIWPSNAYWLTNPRRGSN